MKQIIGISLVLAIFVVSALILPAIAFTAVTLPDYEKDQVIFKDICDNGTTSAIAYRTDARVFVIITVRPSHIFYFLLDNTGKHLLYKPADSPEITELSFEDFGTKLKEYAPGLYSGVGCMRVD